MSSINVAAVAQEPWSGNGARPRRGSRWHDTFAKLVAAGAEMLRESSSADLTVRAVAARAKVAPATAYTYFSSKNHLVAEVYLDLVKKVPYFTDVNESTLTRVSNTLRHLAVVVAEEPNVAAACTAALLGGNDDDAVRRVRDQIGAEIHHRIRSAIGPQADRHTISALEMTYVGALVHAGTGALSYHQVADRLTYVASIIIGEEH
jgi:AcrR family transcriptional regulator